MSSQPKALPGGVWPVNFTPFDDKGRVDYDRTPSLVEFYIEAGCSGLFPAAGSGEMYHLTHEERARVARANVEAARGRIPVIASGGVGLNLAEQIDSVKALADTGIDAVILPSSALLTMGDYHRSSIKTDAMLRIADATDCKLGVYETPLPYHQVIEPDDVKRLAANPKFVYMKETGCELNAIKQKIKVAENSHLGIYPAHPVRFAETLDFGVTGLCAIMANILPGVCVKISQLPSAPAIELAAPLMEIEDALHAHNYPSSGKYLLSKLGGDILPISRKESSQHLTQKDTEAMDQLFDTKIVPLIEKANSL